MKGSSFPDMVCTPVESVYPRHFHNNLFAGYPHLDHRQISGVPQNDQHGNSYEMHNSFLAGLPFTKNNLHGMVDDCVKACPCPNSYQGMKALGGLCTGGQLRSHGWNMVSQTGNSFASGFHHLGGLIIEAQANQKIGQERGATSSSMELKLGQPSEKCRSLKSPVFSAIPSRINDPLKIISQGEIIHKIAAPQVIGFPQYGKFDHGPSISSRKEKQSQVNLPGHAFVASMASNAGNIETLNNDLSRNSRISMLPPRLATSSGGMSSEESTKSPNESHHFIPWIHHFQHHIVRSGQINIAGGTVRPSNADKSVFAANMSKKWVAGNTTNDSLAVSETSFGLYAKQMEKMGFFNRDRCQSYQHSSVDGKKCNLFQLSSMVSDFHETSRLAEDSGEKNCTGSAHIEFIAPIKMNSSMGFGVTFPSQEFSMALSPAKSNPGQKLQSAISNKNEACAGPSNLSASLRRLALVEPREGQMNASLRLNEHQKLQSGGPDVKTRGSLLDLLPSEGQIERLNITSKSNMPEFTSALFSPLFGCQMDNNVGNISSMSGANVKNLTTHRDGFITYSEQMRKHCHGCCDPLSDELPLQGTENEAASRDTCKKCSQRDSNMRRCNCFAYMLSSNKKSESEEASSICGLKKHSISSKAFKICASGISMDCIPAEKVISVENGKVAGLICEELESSIFQGRDVPNKVKEDCRVMCTNEPAHGIGSRVVKPGAEFKDFSAENDPTSSKIDESLKGRNYLTYLLDALAQVLDSYQLRSTKLDPLALIPNPCLSGTISGICC